MLVAGDVAGLDAQALAPIPGGSIELRDARSGSARTVELLRFALGRTQVTRAAWLAVMDDAGTPPPPANVPVHPVTWFDAIAWCNRASALAGLTPAYSVDGREVGWDVGDDGYRLPKEGRVGMGGSRRHHHTRLWHDGQHCLDRVG